MSKKLYTISLLLISIIWTLAVKASAFVRIDYFFSTSIQKIYSDNFTFLFTFISFLASTTFALVSLGLIFIIFRKNLSVRLFVYFQIFMFIVNNLLKIIVKRDRPSDNQLVEVIGYSYPSGHTMFAVCFYILLAYFTYRNRIRYYKFYVIILCLIPILVAMSRIYLGVHYFSDIIGALLISLLCINVFISNVDKIENRIRKLEGQDV